MHKSQVPHESFINLLLLQILEPKVKKWQTRRDEPLVDWIELSLTQSQRTQPQPLPLFAKIFSFDYIKFSFIFYKQTKFKIFIS